MKYYLGKQTSFFTAFTASLIALAFVNLAETNAQETTIRRAIRDTVATKTATENETRTKTKTRTDTNSIFSSYETPTVFNPDHPTIKLFGGIGNTSYNAPNYPGDYNSTNSFTLELGTTTRTNYPPTIFSKAKSSKPIVVIGDTSSIEKLTFLGIFVNFQFDELLSHTEVDPLPGSYPPYPAYNELSKSYAFGFAYWGGANYKAVNIALLNGGDIFWTKLGLKHYPEHDPPDLSPSPITPPASIEPRIADGIRFADKYVAEIHAFKVVDIISLNVGVSRSVIYERHLFGKWVGSSFLVKGVANGLLDIFVERIRHSSALAYPVASFLLKGALDFGFTELQRRKSMNWPFSAPPGYIYDEFHIGLGFEF